MQVFSWIWRITKEVPHRQPADHESRSVRFENKQEEKYNWISVFKLQLKENQSACAEISLAHS